MAYIRSNLYYQITRQHKSCGFHTQQLVLLNKNSGWVLKKCNVAIFLVSRTCTFIIKMFKIRCKYSEPSPTLYIIFYSFFISYSNENLAEPKAHNILPRPVLKKSYMHTSSKSGMIQNPKQILFLKLDCWIVWRVA